MLWWTWILAGIGLLVLEVLTPGGFYPLFFGLAAIVVGVLAGLGVAGPPWLHWILFSVLSVAFLAFFRRPLLERFHLHEPSGQHPSGGLVGDVAVLTEDLAPGGVGKAELRGTAWTVRSSSGAGIARGTRCTVERVEGLTLWVRPEEQGK